MTDTTYPLARITPGPLHSILLGGTVALFLGALSSDIAYARTYQIQWSNFASWLIIYFVVLCMINANYKVHDQIKHTTYNKQHNIIISETISYDVHSL